MKLQRDAFDRAPEAAMPTLYGGCWENIEDAVTVIEFVEVRRATRARARDGFLAHSTRSPRLACSAALA